MRIKLSLVKQWQSLILAKGGGCLGFSGWHSNLAFVGCLDTIMKWPCFVSLDCGDLV